MVAREDLWFRSGTGTAAAECAAWFYPGPAPGAAPVVVMGHGLGAVRDMRLAAFAERFAAAGYAVLVFDYRHFGHSAGLPRQLLDIRRQHQDWAAAIGFARTLPGVDPARVIAWGTSFGGGHVLVAAARDRRVAAVIAQCPFTDGPAALPAAHPVSLAKVTALAVADVVGAAAGNIPVPVRLAGPPGSAALMSTPDAADGYHGLLPEDHPVAGEVAARIALHIPRYVPGRATADILCPALFCVCEHDSLAPALRTIRHAHRAPRGEIVRYPIGHFDIYHGEPFEQAVADQLAFLRRHLPPVSSSSSCPPGR